MTADTDVRAVAVDVDAVNSAVRKLAAACETADRVTAQQYYTESAHNQLAREALTCVLREASALEQILSPLSLGSGGRDSGRLVGFWDVFRREARQRDRDAAADQEQGVTVSHPEHRPSAVVNLDHESSSSVGAPGAVTPGRSRRTVEAPTDSAGVPLRAGRPVGRRSRGWLLRRLRDRSSP